MNTTRACSRLRGAYAPTTLFCGTLRVVFCIGKNKGRETRDIVFPVEYGPLVSHIARAWGMIDRQFLSRVPTLDAGHWQVMQFSQSDASSVVHVRYRPPRSRAA